MTKKTTIDPKVLDVLLQGCERPEDLLGDGGLMKDLKKALMQRMLGAELRRAWQGGAARSAEPPRSVSRETVNPSSAVWVMSKLLTVLNAMMRNGTTYRDIIA